MDLAPNPFLLFVAVRVVLFGGVRQRGKIERMKHATLIFGDAIALAIVTLVGFASHGELALSFLPRIAASFIPLCIGWFLLAPALGLFDKSIATAASELWRPAFVMLFAGPLAVVLRGIVLVAPIMPSFAVVLTVTGALALSVWRLIFVLLKRRTTAPA